MKLNNIISILEEVYPINLQEFWDCSGLLIKKSKVKKILVCLDITPKISEYAINNKVDLIISHHPLIFQNYQYSPQYLRDIFQNLYQANIALYSMHTNYDNHLNGMNYQFIKELNYSVNKNNGMINTFIAKKNLLEQIKVKYPYVRVYNKLEADEVAVVLGAGGSLLNDIIEFGCNTFISSEFKHHEILQAKNNNVMLIDISHQAETIFINDLVNFLNSKCRDIEIISLYDTYTIENL